MTMSERISEVMHILRHFNARLPKLVLHCPLFQPDIRGGSEDAQARRLNPSYSFPILKTIVLNLIMCMPWTGFRTLQAMPNRANPRLERT